MTWPGNDVERLVAIEEIRQLAYDYAYAVNFRDAQLFRSLWVQTDVPTDPPVIDGHMAERFIANFGSAGPSILFVSNHRIWFESGTDAAGTVYCQAQAVRDVGWVNQSIMYQDRYRLVEGRWLFVSRRHQLWFGQLCGENPLEQPPAKWPDSPIGRGTLPEDIESYRLFRAQSDGVDIPNAE